jgi:hypothetical protein
MFHFKPNVYGAHPREHVVGSSRETPGRPLQASKVWIAPTPETPSRARGGVQDSNDARLLRVSTMPESRDEDREVLESSSGGLILRRRTFDEQKKHSQAKANDLIARYELSDVKNTALNKKGTIKSTSTASLRTISYQEAMSLIAKEHDEIVSRTGNNNPLLTKRQEEEKNKAEDKIRRMADWKKTNERDGPPTLRALKSKSFEEQKIETKGSGIISFGGAVPLMIQTKPVERAANDKGYIASNGKTYHCDTLC